MELPTDRHMRRLLTHTVAHAAIDFSCFFVLFARFTPHVQPSQQIALGFLLYNLLAFGLQPLFGFVCDYFRGFPAAPPYFWWNSSSPFGPPLAPASPDACACW